MITGFIKLNYNERLGQTKVTQHIHNYTCDSYYMLNYNNIY